MEADPEADATNNSSLQWLIDGRGADEAAQETVDEVVRRASAVLYDNYLKRREVPFAAARSVECLFSAIERQMLTHDGEPGSADASFIDGRSVAGQARGPRPCVVPGIAAPIPEHYLPCQAGVGMQASVIAPRLAATPSTTGSWIAEEEPMPCAVDSWARAAMPQVHRRNAAQAAAKEAQRQVMEGSYDGTGRPNVRQSRMASNGRSSRRRSKSGTSVGRTSSGLASGSRHDADGPTPVGSPGNTLSPHRRGRRARDRGRGGPGSDDPAAQAIARQDADNRALQQQLGLADRPVSREQPSRRPGPRDSHLDAVRREGLQQLSRAAQEDRQRREDLDRAAKEEEEAEVALRRAARGRQVMVDARSGLVAMRPVRSQPDLDTHGAPVEARIRGQDDRPGSAGAETAQVPGGVGADGQRAGPPGPGGLDDPASWEDALDRPAPVARPAPKDLFQGTDPVREALGAAMTQASRALREVPVRESKREEEGQADGRASRGGGGEPVLDLEAHVRQTGRFYGVEEQQQPLMLHTQALSPGVRAREGSLAQAGPPAASPGRGRVTVSEYIRLARAGEEAPGGDRTGSGQAGVAERESVASKAARAGRSGGSGAGAAGFGGLGNGSIRGVSTEDLLEGGRSVEEARQEARSRQGGEAGVVAGRVGQVVFSPSGSPSRRRQAPPRSSPIRPRGMAGPQSPPAPLAAAGRRMSPKQREAALGRRPQDPRERVPKRAASGLAGDHAPAPLYPATSRFEPQPGSRLDAAIAADKGGGVAAPLSLQSASTGMGEADIYEGGVHPVVGGGSQRLDPAVAALAAAEAAPEMRRVRRSAGLKQTEPASGLGTAAGRTRAGTASNLSAAPGSKLGSGSQMSGRASADAARAGRWGEAADRRNRGSVKVGRKAAAILQEG